MVLDIVLCTLLQLEVQQFNDYIIVYRCLCDMYVEIYQKTNSISVTSRCLSYTRAPVGKANQQILIIIYYIIMCNDAALHISCVHKKNTTSSASNYGYWLYMVCPLQNSRKKMNI